MTDAVFEDDVAPPPRRAADVIGFETAVKKSERKTAIAGLIGIAPLLLFLLVNFLAPITLMLARGVQDREMHAALPATAAALRLWDGKALPDERLAATFVGELAKAKDEGNLSEVANRLNYDRAGMRTLLFHTADGVFRATIPRVERQLSALERIDLALGRVSSNTWAVLKHAAGPLTSFYLLASFDRRLDADHHIVCAPAERPGGVPSRCWAHASWISAGGDRARACCSAIRWALFPWRRCRRSGPIRCPILVLLPFWTSILVRSLTAWIVLLQDSTG